MGIGDALSGRLSVTVDNHWSGSYMYLLKETIPSVCVLCMQVLTTSSHGCIHIHTLTHTCTCTHIHTQLTATETMNYDDAFTLELVTEELLDKFNFVAGIVPILTNHITKVTCTHVVP